MARRRLLLRLGIATTFVALLVAAPSPAFACPISKIVAGVCTTDTGAKSGKDGVDIWGTENRTVPGTHGKGSEDGRSSVSDGEQDDSGAPKPEPIAWPVVCQDGHIECVDIPGPTTPSSDPAQPAAPVVVTLRDIASFTPAEPGNGMQPGGWAITGLPVNFVAEASVQIVSGTLLGQPADVRFTPAGYRWQHSDGATVQTGHPGATWAALDQKEFTPTDTSHTYTEPGDYTVTLEVALTAAYRFAGSDWQHIDGTLTTTSEPRNIRVGQMDTVLTRTDCNTAPDDPGC
ncbi:hypothetical protein BJ978_001589 [Agromyces terreus]|uniref:PKD domain-containing protein n=1 Tax=Agromyces terreus TaxID=424795 RepID=A0A9X2KB05_9MICO|nr:hypothetical protein [Agromyces terreus]MCP2370913.1 hypothetical protein [Agromyces terreus]